MRGPSNFWRSRSKSVPGDAVKPPPPFGDIVWNLLVIIAVLWLLLGCARVTT